MHHALTLHFAAVYAVSSGDASGADLVASGRGWLRGRLVPAAGRSLSIDWSGDPVPTSPRCSDARDTNAYFLVLGTLPRLLAWTGRLMAALVTGSGRRTSGGRPCVRR
jgi:hypothetical protein